MPLSFKPSVWEAESKFVIATIRRTAVGFDWEIYSKVEGAVITSGQSPSLSSARKSCQMADTTITDAESW